MIVVKVGDVDNDHVHDDHDDHIHDYHDDHDHDDDDHSDGDDDCEDNTSRGTRSCECPAPALPCRADSENIKIFETLRTFEAIEEKNNSCRL